MCSGFGCVFSMDKGLLTICHCTIDASRWISLSSCCGKTGMADLLILLYLSDLKMSVHLGF